MPLTINQSIAALLKEKTYAHHVNTERLLVPKLKSIQSVNDYFSILSLFYSFYFSLEPQIHQFLTEEDLHDISERKKIPLLKQDIISLHKEFAEIQICKHLPQIGSRNKALGALYVIEGSTLGGTIIADMIIKRAGDFIGVENLNFFNGYGVNTSEKWKAFQSALEDDMNDPDEIIEAAIETFNCMALHISKTLWNGADKF